MKFLHTKAGAWTGMVLVLAMIVVTFRMRIAWWAFADEFFGFLTVFCELAALYLGAPDTPVRKKLQTAGTVCGVLTILSLIGEYIAFEAIYG